MIKKNFYLLENARKCSKIARNICYLARKLLEIYAARLGLARIFLENELLENARLGFYFRCSKSPITHNTLHTKFVDAFYIILPIVSIVRPNLTYSK